MWEAPGTWKTKTTGLRKPTKPACLRDAIETTGLRESAETASLRETTETTGLRESAKSALRETNTGLWEAVTDREPAEPTKGTTRIGKAHGRSKTGKLRKATGLWEAACQWDTPTTGWEAKTADGGRPKAARHG